MLYHFYKAVEAQYEGVFEIVFGVLSFVNNKPKAIITIIGNGITCNINEYFVE